MTTSSAVLSELVKLDAEIHTAQQFEPYRAQGFMEKLIEFVFFIRPTKSSLKQKNIAKLVSLVFFVDVFCQK